MMARSPGLCPQLPLGRAGGSALLALRGLRSGRGGGGGGARGTAAARAGPAGAGEGPQTDRVHLTRGSRGLGAGNSARPERWEERQPLLCCPDLESRWDLPWESIQGIPRSGMWNKSLGSSLWGESPCPPALGSALGSSSRRGMWNKSWSSFLEWCCGCFLGGSLVPPVLRVPRGVECGINPDPCGWSMFGLWEPPSTFHGVQTQFSFILGDLPITSHPHVPVSPSPCPAWWN